MFSRLASWGESYFPLSLSGLVFFNGLLAVVTTFYARFPGQWQALMPLPYWYFHRPLHLILGFLLMYFSVQIRERKVVAWWVSLLSSIVIFISSSFHGLSLINLLFPFFVIVFLLWYKDSFTVKGEIRSVVQGIRFFALCVAIALLYGIAGFYLLDKREFGIDFSWWDAVIRVLREFTFIGNDDLIPHTRHATWFITSLDILGTISFGFGMYSLFRPLQYYYQTLPHEREEVKKLIEHYSQTTEDFFKVWPEDKSYFFSTTRQCVIAYKTVNGVAISRGDPVGDAAEIPGLIDSFTQFCQIQGWNSCFLHVEDTYIPIYAKHKYDSIKIGEDAIIDLSNLKQLAKRDKYFRNLQNRFPRLSYQVEKISAPIPYSILQEMKVVSTSWLSQEGKKELGFAMGYFSYPYVRQLPTFALYSPEEKLLGFVNEIPPCNKRVSIDLIRYRADIPSGGIDYLLLATMLHLEEEGYEEFDLGLAPLSGTYEGEVNTIVQRSMKLLYESKLPLPFKGLRQFKEKFEPVWEPRFVVFTGGSGSVLRISLAIRQAMEI